MIRMFLTIAAVTVAFASLAEAAESVKVDVVFSGLKWEPQEVENWGRPDQTVTPPKETREVYKEWCLACGGTDVVDVDVTIIAGEAVKEPVEVRFQYEEKGRLTASMTLARIAVDLPPGATQVLHGSIKLADYIQHRHNPDSIRVVTSIGKRRPVTAKLPILLGD